MQSTLVPRAQMPVYPACTIFAGNCLPNTRPCCHPAESLRLISPDILPAHLFFLFSPQSLLEGHNFPSKWRGCQSPLIKRSAFITAERLQRSCKEANEQCPGLGWRALLSDAKGVPPLGVSNMFSVAKRVALLSRPAWGHLICQKCQ